MGVQHWMVAASLLGATAAHAGDAGYDVSQKVGYAGFISALAGPPVTAIGAVVGVGSGTFGGDGQIPDASGWLVVGAGLILVGQAGTTLGPSIAVGGSLGGGYHVKGMGGSPNLTAGYVGLAGVGVQVAGIAWALAEPFDLDSDSIARPQYLLRFTGWTTAVMGSGLQLAANRRGYGGLAVAPPHRRVTVQLVPAPRGIGLAGTF